MAWNQLAATKNKVVTPVESQGWKWSYWAFGVGTYNHVYLMSADYSFDGDATDIFTYLQVGTGGSITFDETYKLEKGKTKRVTSILKQGSTTGGFLFGTGTNGVRVMTGSDAWSVDNIMVVDLTQLYGSTIADYLYTLETSTRGSINASHSGAGVAWFRKYFPKPYYEYNAGELMSVKALRHITRGFNAWDEEWESGSLNFNTGEKVPGSSNIRSKNFIKALPNTTYFVKMTTGTVYLFEYDADKNFIKYNQTYTVTTTSNTAYFLFVVASTYGTTYNHDLCINLHWDGERDGDYEEYAEHVYELDPDLELRGIPKLTAGNDLYFDGDVYEPDGTVTRKYGVVDLGTLGWVKYNSTTYNNLFYAAMPTMRPTPSAYEAANILCINYKTITQALVGTRGYTDKYISGGAVNSGNARFWLNDEAYTEVSELKSALSGVYVVYELATPTEESADPYNGTQIVDD